MNEETLFHQASQLPPDERKAFLDKICGNDAALRARLEKLLDAYDHPDSLLQPDSPAFVPTVAGPASAEGVGASIGPYKLLEQIGEGGFGIVYMADQQSPVRRRVALKILKPGMDTRQVLARFEAERQALALMDHINIARALDAGATETGRPYFVMELVRGIPITDYCDQNNLAVHDRLDLFVQVCHAVQHAHQKGVIHRDIKPSNVLVTVQDERPVPKVIDFGVAKAINQHLTAETLFTRFAEMIGTPLYMSPEQAEMTSLDIDTRSDIYSLGVLLYELLTGTTPLEKDRMKQAAFDEIRRIIRDEEPPKPSTRISTLFETGTAVAAHRHADPHRLSQIVRGDLDWIVMKALEKDRTRRYDTASNFAADVLRYLSHRPVEACPPSAAYRFRKFARRNRLAIMTAAIIVAALVAGTVVSSMQAIRATHAETLAENRLKKETEARKEAVQQRHAAEQARQAEAAQRQIAEAQRAEADTNFRKARQAVDEYFTLVSESKLFDVPGLQPLRKQLLEAALRYYQGFLEQRSSDPKVRAELAVTYLRVSYIYEQNDRADDAIQALRKGLEIVEVLLKQNRRTADFATQLAGSRKGGRTPQLWHRWPSDMAAAIGVYEKATGLWETFVRDNPTVAGLQSDLASFSWRVGDLYWGRAMYDRALPSFQKAAQIWETLSREYPGVPEYRADLAESLDHIGKVLMDTDQRAESEASYRRALALREKLVAELPDHPDYRAGLANSFRRLGTALHSFGRHQEAEKVERKSIELWSMLANEFPKFSVYRRMLGVVYFDLAGILKDTGRLQEAEATYRRVIEVREPLAHESPRNEGYNVEDLSEAHALLADLLRNSNRLDEAKKEYREALELAKKLATNSPAIWGTTNSPRRAAVRYVALAKFLKDVGQPREAEETFREAVDFHSKLAAAHPDQIDLRLIPFEHNIALAQLLKAEKRTDGADQAYGEALAVMQTLVADDPGQRSHRSTLATTYHEYAVWLHLGGREEGAERACRQGLELEQKLIEESPDDINYRYAMAWTLELLSQILQATNRPDEGLEHCRRATEFLQRISAERPAELTYRANFAYANGRLASLLRATHKPQDAEIAYQKSIALWERLESDKPNEPYSRSNLARNFLELAQLLDGANRLQEAEKAARRSLEINLKLANEFPSNIEYRYYVGSVSDLLAKLCERTKRLPEAETLCRQALKYFQGVAADAAHYQQSVAYAYIRLADVLKKNEKLKEAEEAQRQGEALRKKEPGPANPKPEEKSK